MSANWSRSLPGILLDPDDLPRERIRVMLPCVVDRTERVGHSLASTFLGRTSVSRNRLCVPLISNAAVPSVFRFKQRVLSLSHETVSIYELPQRLAQNFHNTVSRQA